MSRLEGVRVAQERNERRRMGLEPGDDGLPFSDVGPRIGGSWELPAV